jgi:large subunit ribosomal protein L32
MANPKKKHTPMRRNMRRASNFRLESINLSKCSQCSAEIIPHRVCPKCGYYRGEMILAPHKQKKKSDEK